MTDIQPPAAETAHDSLAALPAPGLERALLVDARLALSRTARAEGDRGGAVAIIEAALRAGLWRHGRLWTELLSLMDEPADYTCLRSLWWESPLGCHSSVPILRAVARAASVAGEHDDARTLLRKAILLQARHTRRLRARLGRLKRSMIAHVVRPRQASLATFERRAATALADLNHDLYALGVRAFLISGTLLGYVRESTFISWDKDIDVGVFSDAIEPSELEKAFDRSPRFDVRRLDFNSDRLRVNHTNGVWIDIFPHYLDSGNDGRIWHDGTATRWWNTPFELKAVDFLGQAQFVPDPPGKYLDENYGDWQTPKPDFDARFDAPNIEITDPDYFDTLLYFSLLDSLAKNRRAGCQRYTQLLKERGEGAWLSRV